LNSPPHPERRRIDEFASHNLTLRSQLSNSMIQHSFGRHANGYSGETETFAARHLSRSAKEIAHRTGISWCIPWARHNRREFSDSHQA